MPKSSRSLSLQAILFQELKLLLIRCFKEDSSLTLILTDIDLVSTINKFQLTPLTEQRLPTIKEMVQLLSMETKVELSTTSQIPKVDQRKISDMLSKDSQLLDLLEDIITLIQILLMSNQEFSGIKCSLRLREKLSSETCLDLLAPSPTDQSKKVSSLTSIRLTQTMETDLPKPLVFQLTKQGYEIF